MIRVRNSYPAGQVTPPVTTAEPQARPLVMVCVEWQDGRKASIGGSAIRWTAEAVLVAFTGPDGLGRQEWFSIENVRPR